ncbi:MAG: Lrp/AsnC family transcriptional regulator [Archaeoglobaceae archaeon]
MDEKDLEILATLVEDSRTTLQKIAEKTKLSISSVHKRVKRLEKDVIEKYTLLLNPEKFNYITAFLLISSSSDVSKELFRIPEVIEIYQTFGNYNFIAKVRGKGIEKIAEISNKVSSLNGVEDVLYLIATRRIKEIPWKPG